MNVGINIYSKWPYAEIVKAFKKNNIERTFVCIDHPEFTDVMRCLKRNNISVDNFHAPFRDLNRIWCEENEGVESFKKYLDSVDACVKYEVPVLVAHVSNGRPMPPISERGIERFTKFMSYANCRGVTVAIENHRYEENVTYIMKKFPHAAFCYDTCHAHGFTPDVDYVSMWGDRMVATHISDNDCVCDKDMHMIPFDGIIDYDSVAKKLAKCKYAGTLMLEIKPGNHILYENISIDEYYYRGAQSLNRLNLMVEKYKNK